MTPFRADHLPSDGMPSLFLPYSGLCDAEAIGAEERVEYIIGQRPLSESSARLRPALECSCPKEHDRPERRDAPRGSEPDGQKLRIMDR
jgi:hypothetical protein